MPRGPPHDTRSAAASRTRAQGVCADSDEDSLAVLKARRARARVF